MCACVCACVCVRVCVCVFVRVGVCNKKKVPEEWQARQQIPAILLVSSSKHNAQTKILCVRVRAWLCVCLFVNAKRLCGDCRLAACTCIKGVFKVPAQSREKHTVSDDMCVVSM